MPMASLSRYLEQFGHLGAPGSLIQSTQLSLGLVGQSPAIQRLRELIRKYAPTKRTVLIAGEAGTGKETVARTIHYESMHGGGEFVRINCSAIPHDRLERELFGFTRCAVPGTIADGNGRFAMAAGGTLFLEEIGDVPPALQARLIRAINEKVFFKVGCEKPVPMTARIVLATNRNLEECGDSAYLCTPQHRQIDVDRIMAPSLRDRTEDIPCLVSKLSAIVWRERGAGVKLTSSALACLQKHNWPGNLRELCNLLQRLSGMYPNGIVDAVDLPHNYRVERATLISKMERFGLADLVKKDE